LLPRLSAKGGVAAAAAAAHQVTRGKLYFIHTVAGVAELRASVPPRDDAASVVNALLLLPDQHVVVKAAAGQDLPKLWVRKRDAPHGPKMRLPLCLA